MIVWHPACRDGVAATRFVLLLVVVTDLSRASTHVHTISGRYVKPVTTAARLFCVLQHELAQWVSSTTADAGNK